MKERAVGCLTGCLPAILIAAAGAAIGINEMGPVEPLLNCNSYIRNADLHFKINDVLDTASIFGRSSLFEKNEISINPDQSLTFLFGSPYRIRFSSGESVITNQVISKVGQPLSVDERNIVFNIDTSFAEKGVDLEINAACK